MEPVGGGLEFRVRCFVAVRAAQHVFLVALVKYVRIASARGLVERVIGKRVWAGRYNAHLYLRMKPPRYHTACAYY